MPKYRIDARTTWSVLVEAKTADEAEALAGASMNPGPENTISTTFQAVGIVE